MSSLSFLDLSDAVDRKIAGAKAGVLADLTAAGFTVPPGFVVPEAALDDPGFEAALVSAARRLGGDRFAVRSSARAEDQPDASYAGLYETFLGVPTVGLVDAVQRCFAAASLDRVRVHRQRHAGLPGMAVLVQVMVDPTTAGVVFTADPITGDRQRSVITAAAGLGEKLVGGEVTGEQWTVTTTPALTRPAATPTLTAEQASAIAALARQIEHRYRRPQDVEWAIDNDGRLWLLQARPMTALPEPPRWAPPGPGLWWRNFRLGEWLPEAVTPLFATWLLPALEDGYLDGMQTSIGIRVPFRYALVNGWYYNATPTLSPHLLAHVIRHGRARGIRTLYHALVTVSRDPAGADRAVLADLNKSWTNRQLPCYRKVVAAADREALTADPHRLVSLIDEMAQQAGIALWYLAVLGGSAWKMEACLTRFTRRHLADVLPTDRGGGQVLLRGLHTAAPDVAGHAIYNADWYHPTAGELSHFSTIPVPRPTGLPAQRGAAEQECADALTGRPRLLTAFHQLLRVSQRYAEIRETQAHELTLAWPALRACARRLGDHLTAAALIDSPDDVFFCTRTEVQTGLSRPSGSLATVVTGRRALWQHQRNLAAPLTLGTPPRLIGDVMQHAVEQARQSAVARDGTIVGHPASAGRATGPVRVVTGPCEFGSFRNGEVLVAKATTPAWTALFGDAAAVVTDTGTLAAHASLIAREYGIPAVVGTGDATHRLHTGQYVTVDGSVGTVTVHPATT
ncbi:MAG: PEP/pyruvate-binding domain-containing protein [Jiangellaceae bacterium]